MWKREMAPPTESWKAECYSKIELILILRKILTKRLLITFNRFIHFFRDCAALELSMFDMIQLRMPEAQFDDTNTFEIDATGMTSLVLHRLMSDGAHQPRSQAQARPSKLDWNAANGGRWSESQSEMLVNTFN